MTKRVHHFKVASSAPASHDLKAADLVISKPVFDGNPPDNLSAASLTSGAPEFTAPAMRQLRQAHKDEIKADIDAELNAAAAAKRKPPSPRELRELVLPRLLARGLKARKKSIEQEGTRFKKRFPSRFQPRGKRWESF